MHTLFARLRWPFLTAIFIAAVFCWLLITPGAWEAFGVFSMRPAFADLIAILAAGDAHAFGLDVFKPNPLDPWGRPHVYGPLWLASAPLGLSTADSWWLGLLLVGAFFALAIRLLSPSTALRACLAILILLSPPLLLAVERANNDIVILLLLVGAAPLIASASRWHAVGGAILVFAATLKIYPIAALCAIAGAPLHRRRILFMAGASAAAFAGIWILQHDLFARALEVAPRPETLFAYGLKTFPIALSLAAPAPEALLAGWLAGAILSITLIWSARRDIAPTLPPSGSLAAAAAAGAACWIFCYLANTNYPYRIILLLPVVAAWLANLSSPADGVKRASRRLLALFMAGLWLALPKFWTAEAYAAAGRSAWARELLFFTGVEQAVIFALTLLMGAALAHWLLRRWQESGTCGA